MLHGLKRLLSPCTPVLRNLLGSRRSYRWVYEDGQDGYNENIIEERFSELSKGGSVCLDIEGEISTVTISNPRRKNAFSGSMIVRLREVLKSLWDCEKTKAVILRGDGDSFCAGLDLNLAALLTEPKDGRDMCMYMQNTLTAFQQLPCITVATIRGPALGGGAEIITAADFRLMYPGSIIQFVHKRMGIIPGWGGATRLQDIVGKRKAMYMLASSESLDCKSALLSGLADALISDSEEGNLTAANEWLQQTFNLSATDRNVFAAIKSATLSSQTDGNGYRSIGCRLRRERDLLATLWGNSPNLKAINKALSKK